MLSASFEPFGHSLECRAACSVQIGAYAPAAANSPYRLNSSLRNIAYCEFTQTEQKRSPAGPMIKGKHLNLESGLWEREQGLRISNCTKTTAVSHETRPKQTRRRSETEAEGGVLLLYIPMWKVFFLRHDSVYFLSKNRTDVEPPCSQSDNTCAIDCFLSICTRKHVLLLFSSRRYSQGQISSH